MTRDSSVVAASPACVTQMTTVSKLSKVSKVCMFRRTANTGGAADSSQMSSLFSTAPTPSKPVTEPIFVEDTVDSVTATPFFSQDTGVVLIKGGDVVNCEETSTADVLVVDGKITAVGEDLDIPENATVINASGKYVIPGGIDTNTHFRRALDGKDPVLDDFQTGSRAAVAGGTTMVVDLVIPEPEEGLLAAVTAWKEEAQENSCCDFSLAVAVTCVTEQTIEEMEVLVRDHGVNTFKVFMSFKDELMIPSKDILRVMKKAKELGCVVQVHAENGDMIAQNQRALLAEGVRGPEGHLLAHPEDVEEEAVRRACCLAREVGLPLHISSPSSAGAVEIIKEYREKGLVVIFDPSIAALTVDGSHYYNKCYSHAANFVTSPPLREGEEAREALLAGLQTDLAVVSSAHCARDRTEAGTDFSQILQGVTGAEERLPLLYEVGVQSGKMEMERLVAVTSATAAKILNIYPRKGCIAEGSDADIVILNPAAPRTISHKSQQSNAELNIFEDLTVTAGPEFVIAGGKIVVAEFQVNADCGGASFVDCLPFPAVCYQNISQDRPEPRHVDRPRLPSDDVDGRSDSIGGDGFGLTTPRGFRGQQVLNKQLGVYQRPLSAHGVRNQQDSTFSLTG